MHFRTPLTLAVSALLLSVGAASVPSATVARVGDSHGQSCFWGHDVDNFSALPDERTLYLRVGVRDYYELKLFAPCQDIDWDHRIAIVARGGGDWICEGNGLDTEIIAHATGLGPQRCQVTRVRKLSPADLNAIPKRYRP